MSLGGDHVSSVVYLILAYSFATLVLGGYLAWSLRRLRELERKS